MSSGVLVVHVLCLLAVLVSLHPGQLVSLLPAGLLTRLSPGDVEARVGGRLADQEMRELLLQRARENSLLRNPALLR